MLRKCAVVFTGLILAASIALAEDAKQKPAKKGTPATKTYTVVSVDADAKTIKVESDGKSSTLKVTSATKILGPMGGKKTGGLADPRLKPGAAIRVVMEGMEVKEIYLPRMSGKGKLKKVPEKTDGKSKDK